MCVYIYIYISVNPTCFCCCVRFLVMLCWRLIIQKQGSFSLLDSSAPSFALAWLHQSVWRYLYGTDREVCEQLHEPTREEGEKKSLWQTHLVEKAHPSKQFQDKFPDTPSKQLNLTKALTINLSAMFLSPDLSCLLSVRDYTGRFIQ